MTLKILFLIFLVELFDAGSQIVFKRSVNTLGIDPLRGVNDYRSFFLKVITMPGIWCGFALVAGGLIIWWTVLAQVDLSLAFPFGSMQFLLVMGASYLFLGEEVNWMRLLGTACIVVGILCVALS